MSIWPGQGQEFREEPTRRLEDHGEEGGKADHEEAAKHHFAPSEVVRPEAADGNSCARVRSPGWHSERLPGGNRHHRRGYTIGYVVGSPAVDPRPPSSLTKRN